MKSLRLKKNVIKTAITVFGTENGGDARTWMPVRGCRCSLFNGGPQQLNYEERIRV